METTLTPPRQNILTVLYVDPAAPTVGKQSDLHDCNPDRPPATMALTTRADDPNPSGLYHLTGEKRAGRWLYELSEQASPASGGGPT